MRTCTLIIENEVSCYFSGLDKDTEIAVSKVLTYQVPGARFSQKYKLGWWDGKAHLWNRGWTYTNLVDEVILDIIEANGYELDVDDRRKPVSIVPELVPNDLTLNRQDGSVVTLRDYQVEAANKAIQSGQGVLRLATGAGKSYICGALAKSFLEANGTVVVIVPSVDLVHQTANSFRDFGMNCGEFSGEKKDVQEVTVSTWQSLSNYPEVMGGVTCVIMDECHKIKGSELLKLMTEAAKDVPYRYGFTGTLPEDELGRAHLKSAVGELIFKKDAWELQEDGVLSKCSITVLQTQEKASLMFDDYSSEARFLANDDNRLGWLASRIREMQGNTLVLVRNVATGKDLADLVGDRAVFLSGSTKTTSRKEHYESVADEDDKILICTKGIASTGIDIPRIFNLVIFEPGKSFVETIQSIGRGLRRAEDKDHVDIYDICASTKYSKRHLSSRKKFYKEAKYPFKMEKVDISKELQIIDQGAFE